jgi:hypothetical protein
MLLGVLHYICGVSFARCKFVLHAIRKILELAYRSRGGSLTVEEHLVLNSLPNDPRTMFRQFDIEEDTKAFVCCPKCYKCYTMDPENRESYPVRCTNEPTSTSGPCNRTLRKVHSVNGREYWRPSRKFVYHDMRKWVGKFINRPGLEDVLDRKYSPSLAPEVSPEGFCDDILGSRMIREFRGPDQKTPFLDTPGNLIFTLSMDGFNPYGMTQAGKKVSVGAIYMVCLNLPPELRYRFENMYLVGIIPGPGEPSLDQINYLLEPLVEDLLKFWESGIFFSHTPNRPCGRLIRCAVVPLVCDLPAARKMAGFASFGATQFCSFCMQKLQDMNDTNVTEWVRRTGEEHRQCAAQWLEAKSHAAREKLVRKTGVRYSALLRLPYWDPTRFTLVDSMHAFFLGNLKRHCRDIWGMDVQLADGDGIWVDGGENRSSAPSETEIARAWTRLRSAPGSTFTRETTVPVLRRLCRDAGCFPAGKGNDKGALAKAILQHVSFLSLEINA